jgi:hypothetical protein
MSQKQNQKTGQPQIKKLVLKKTTVSGFSNILMSNTRTTTGSTKMSDFMTCLI